MWISVECDSNFFDFDQQNAASIEEKKRTLENSEVHCRIYKKSLKKG